MTDIIDANGFRANVGIVLMREPGEVFLGRRTGGRGWQFPQGGMQRGESFEAALYRELQEEVGLRETDVELIGHTSGWLRYRLPARYIRRNRRPLCIGQKQRWYLLRLRSEGSAIDLSGSTQPEFDEWRWIGYWEPVREIIHFKRPVYMRALEELASFAFPQGPQEPPDWWEEFSSTGRARRQA